MNLESQPLVSVVTPVYNAEKYLAECIESVLAQTYQNWEYVIVNNCSSDHSLEIAERYAQRDARIRICNNTEFLSVIQNFNHTVRQISPESKYCKVVHADDWLFPNCIMEMVKVAEANPSVGIVGSYVLEGTRVKCDGLPYPSTVLSGRELCRAMLLDSSLYVFGSPTSLLIRSDLIRSREVFYNEANIHAADKEACFDVLQHTNFGFVHQVLTYTRVHPESQTAIQRSINTLRLGNLMIFMKYGPVYLSNEEYEKRMKQIIESYYRFLGKSALQRKGREFWNYHREGLGSLGLPLNRVKLVKAIARALYLNLMNGLSHPKTSAQNAVRLLQREQRRT